MKRGGFIKRGKALRAESSEHRMNVNIRKAVVEVVHERDRTCQAIGLMPNHVCAGPFEVHERIRRSQWPQGYLVASNCLLLCAQAHREVHANPAISFEVGLLAHEWDREAW